MVREYGHISERFEDYILEHTGDHPNVIPIVMGSQGKARFRLTCKKTRNSSEFSSWFDEASLYGGPGMLQLDHEIVVCLRECLEGE